MAILDITPALKLMTEKNGSDLFFSTNAAIHLKIEGETMPVNDQVLAPGVIQDIAYGLMSKEQIQEFESVYECNFATAKKGIGRFRVNVFRQRGEVSMVIRHIKTKIPSLETLNLPKIVNELIMRKKGLLLVVGSAGSGKSTSLASMVDYRNANSNGHIITIEDPIEFIHTHKKSVVDQREIGIDTLSFNHALRNAMRQAPDLILIGEINSMEAMKQALAYAETGQLCLATLHANNVNQALERIISFFPNEAKQSLLLSLSLNLVSVISQSLVPSKVKKHVAATEILLNTPYISELIAKQKLNEIKKVMADNSDIGMHTLDQSLLKLFNSELIDEKSALDNADSRNDLSLKIRFSAEGARGLPDSGFNV